MIFWKFFFLNYTPSLVQSCSGIRIRLFMWMDPDPKIGGMVNKLYIFICGLETRLLGGGGRTG